MADDSSTQDNLGAGNLGAGKKKKTTAPILLRRAGKPGARKQAKEKAVVDLVKDSSTKGTPGSQSNESKPKATPPPSDTHTQYMAFTAETSLTKFLFATFTSEIPEEDKEEIMVGLARGRKHPPKS